MTRFTKFILSCGICWPKGRDGNGSGVVEIEGRKKKVEDREELFKIIAEKIVEMLVEKDKVYGSENLKLFGVVGVAIRMSDKIARILNIALRGVESKEGLEDALKDIAGYAILALAMLEEGELTSKGWLEKFE